MHQIQVKIVCNGVAKIGRAVIGGWQDEEIAGRGESGEQEGNGPERLGASSTLKGVSAI
jgi:hypothetical protein